MNQMNIELSKMQLIHLGNICKKGWGGYSEPSDDLEEMIKNGLLTKSAGPFGDVVYRPTDAGRSYINDFNKDRKEQIMNKRAIQIDVIGKVEGTQFMKCKLYTNENIVIIMMNEFDYERLKKEGIFIRDGKSRDSAGVLNTTNTFIEEN